MTLVWPPILPLMQAEPSITLRISPISYSLPSLTCSPKTVHRTECVCVSCSATPWTVAHQAPLSMEFSRQEYWSGLPFPSSGDLPRPGIEPRSPALQADSLLSEPPGRPLCTELPPLSDWETLKMEAWTLPPLRCPAWAGWLCVSAMPS